MALLLEIKISPQSGRQQCILDDAGSLKCYVKSSPEHGRANNELIKLLATKLGLPQYAVKIVKGAIARRKIIKIETSMDQSQAMHRLLQED